jgi:hypothetical protein
MSDEQRPDNRQQPKPPKAQYLSPQTAAKKLGVYLAATPAEFQTDQISRDDLAALQADPPSWLVDLRKNGPHPRSEVSRRLGITNSGLTRAGVSDALTTDEIKALLDEPPAWLIAERRRVNP